MHHSNLWTATRDPHLPTSRTASNQERGVLAIVRALAPRRRLNSREAELIAELQANRLLELAGMPEAPVPNALISELPRIAVRVDPDLPASGSAHWSNGRWLLTINASEPWTRQRFSLCHELKHVIDHRHVDLLYADEQAAERAADHFAACLLMPKRYVKRLWGRGTQDLSTLSARFGVSSVAMARRLDTLGLRHSAVRRSTKRRLSNQQAHYQRPLPVSVGVTA